MARAYCTLDEVKRVLRTAAKKVRTSEAYRNLDYNRDNSGDVRLKAITLLDSYVGSERFEIEFSDSTSFEVTGEDAGFLGTGSMLSDFSCSYFTISPSQWQGAALSGDRVSFITNSNISTDDATQFVNGVAKWINNQLGVPYADSTNIPWEADLTVAIPDPLNYAAIYRSAYEIFSSIFAGAELENTPVTEWKNIADNAVNKYVQWYEEEQTESTPRWMSREIFFDELGITNVGKGLMNVRTDSEKDKGYTR